MGLMFLNKSNVEKYLQDDKLMLDLLDRIKHRMLKQMRYPNQKKKEVQLTF